VTEFVDAERLRAAVTKAVRGGSAADGAALQAAVLDTLGGQWVNSLVLCQVVAHANGSFAKVPLLVQNQTVLLGEIYENATQAADARCQYWLGRMFESGCSVDEEGKEVVTKDVNQAAQLYMAAGAEVPEANRALGVLLESHGDVDTAGQLYAKALEMGDVRALALLGALYQEHGSLPEALDLYTQGASAEEPLAQTCLALLALEGNGVAKDEAQAVELLIAAASRLECSAFYLLGRVLEEGLGIASNVEVGAQMYEVSANLGHAAAAAALARLYNEGRGVVADGEKALSWAQRASDAGMQWSEDGADAHSAGAGAEYAALKTPLQGGRPSRYEYIPITTYPLSKEEKAQQDAKGFTGADPAPGAGETARYRYKGASDYFRTNSVLYKSTNDAPSAA